jgi:hypothetical protein
MLSSHERSKHNATFGIGRSLHLVVENRVGNDGMVLTSLL